MNSPSRIRSRICGSAFVFATCLGIWLPRADAATLVDLDATQLPEGPLTIWTNAGMIGGDFAMPTNAIAPSVSNVDGIRAVRFLSTGVSGGGGTHYIGPEVPAQLTGAGARTVEAWIHNPTPQLEETIFAWGRRGGIGAPEGKNFSFGHGTNLVWGAVAIWGSADIGWANHQTYGRWTYVVATYDGTTTRVYSDGQLANSETNVLNTAMFAASTTNATIDSTNLLHFRIARQNTDTGGVDTTGAGVFSVAQIKVYDFALDGATIQGLFDSQKASFNLNDTDGDGLPDWYEARCGLDKNDVTGVNGANGDKDGDGLTNLQEFQLGTRADLADTDGDGASDGAEVNRISPRTGLPAPTNPLNSDTDGDGLKDGVETDSGVVVSQDDTGTDPLKPDTDGDGYPDGIEVAYCSDPNDRTSIPFFCDPIPCPPCGPLINLDATKLPVGPLNTWTNKGTLGDDFVAPTNATTPSVVVVDGVKSVAFQAAGGASGGTHFVGPEVPAVHFNPYFPVNLTDGGARTVEAWIHDQAPQSEKTIFAWGRHGGSTPDGKNFALGHGTNAVSGAVNTGGTSDIGWANQEVLGRWTYLVITYSLIALTDSQTNYYWTNVLSAYVDGQLVNIETNTIETAAFAAAAPNSPTDSTNLLHFRIARQNNDTGGVDGAGIGAFNLARLRVSGFAMNPSSILARFNSEQKQFQAPLRIEAICVDRDSGAATLSWIAAPGRSVSIQTSSNLLAWSSIASNLLGNNYTEVSSNFNRPCQFYRLSSP